MTTDSPLYLELLETLSSSLEILPDKPEETPTSCLRALWLTAAGYPSSAASAMNKTLPPIDESAESILRNLIAERLNSKPLAYLTGRQQFMGVEFISTPQAVIPRKDTEPLIKTVLKYISEGEIPLEQQIVIDVFTGSGNIPLTLAKLIPGPRYYGSDLSADAIDLANLNAKFLRQQSSCTFFCGDLLVPFENGDFNNQVDIISGAPPFISSSKVPTMPKEISQHEPSLAFDAGPFGIGLFNRLIKDAPIFLKQGGWLCFEVGLGQGPSMLKRLEKDPRYVNEQSFCDDSGDIRVVVAQKN